MGDISSYAVLDYREPLVLETFSSGNAAFARNWFYQTAELNKDSFLAGKFGIAPLPGKNGTGVGALGDGDLQSVRSQIKKIVPWNLLLRRNRYCSSKTCFSIKVLYQLLPNI